MPENTVVNPAPASTPGATPAPAVAPAAVVIPPAGQPAQAPVQDDGKGEFVPRTRLNEVLTKQHEAEERARVAEERARQLEQNPPATPAMPQVSEIDRMAEQVSLESGVDEFGTRLVSPAAARAQIIISARLNAVSTAGVRMKQNIDRFTAANPRAAKYSAQIEQELSALEPGVKDNPANVERKYRELIGKSVEDIEREAFERGKQAALENRRIVSNAIGESPSPEIPAGKTAEEMLTPDERAQAVKSKMTYDTYYTRKHNKRVVDLSKK